MGFFKKGEKRKLLPVAILGNEVLKKVAEPVGEITDDILDLCDQMVDAMYEYDGIGLAAPQVAISKRIVVLDVPGPGEVDEATSLLFSPGERLLLPKMPIVLINPEVTLIPQVLEKAEEGCLSVPDINGQVERPTKVMFRSKIISVETGKDEDVSVECAGLLARCLQHEVDHLDGIVFLDRMTLPDRVRLKPKLTKLKRVAKKNNYLRYS